eukprot:11194308-Lingulodinium_polyedra.AAC.1
MASGAKWASFEVPGEDALFVAQSDAQDFSYIQLFPALRPHFFRPPILWDVSRAFGADSAVVTPRWA